MLLGAIIKKGYLANLNKYCLSYGDVLEYHLVTDRRTFNVSLFVRTQTE
jgi:hypothetical protein